VLGHGIPLASLGVSSAAELLAALPDVFSVRGRGARKVVVPAQATLGTGPGPTVAAFSGHGSDMLRLVTPGQVARSLQQVCSSSSSVY
jgi:hypothetical protein